MHPSAQHMFQLFAGYDDAYGLYKLDDDELTPDGKQKGHGTTIRGQVTVDLWSDHLRGKSRLGIIPLGKENTVRWACIDIDVYSGLSYAELYKRVRDKKLPLVLVRTKSGGVHCYVFFNEWAKAAMVRRKLTEIAAAIGHGSAEIFPKQDQALHAKGDMASWVNMPYYDTAKTAQWGIDPEKGTELPIEEFIRLAYAAMISPTSFSRLKVYVEHEAFKDGPPCLNHIAAEGVPEGMRNDTLFNIAIYAKKFSPDNWRQLVEQFHSSYFDPPLSAKEVLNVIKSVAAKDYGYTCDRPPISTYCDKVKCRGCKFGIGGSTTGLPVLGTLTKFNSKPPIWFVEVEDGGRLMLTTDELQQPYGFQRAAMEQLNKMPIVPKRETWNNVVNDLMTRVMVIDAPEEASAYGALWEHLEEFCMTKSHDERDGILRGLVWTHDGKHYFRIKDFIDYLSRKKFGELQRNHIVQTLKERGGELKQLNVLKKCVSVCGIPVFERAMDREEYLERTFSNEEDPF